MQWKRWERLDHLPLTTSVPKLEPEAGIWYAFCLPVIVARYAARRIRLGSWKKLQSDDYLMVIPFVRIHSQLPGLYRFII